MAHEAIEKYIRAVLTGSGLDLQRRSEVARELLDHIEQSIARRVPASSSEDAVHLALADLGPPDRVRRSLRQVQRAADRRQAWARIRRQIWLPPLLTSPLAVGIAGLAPHGQTMTRLGVGAFVGVCLTVYTLASMYLTALLEIDAKRRRPHGEFHPGRRLLRWFGILVSGLASFVLAGAVVSALAVKLFGVGPAVELFPLYLILFEDDALLRQTLDAVVKAVLFALASGAALTFYERRRCLPQGVAWNLPA